MSNLSLLAVAALQAELVAERERKTKLLEAAKTSVDRLEEAQGDWVFVDWTYAPEHVRALRPIVDALRAAIIEAEKEPV